MGPAFRATGVGVDTQPIRPVGVPEQPLPALLVVSRQSLDGEVRRHAKAHLADHIPNRAGDIEPIQVYPPRQVGGGQPFKSVDDGINAPQAD